MRSVDEDFAALPLSALADAAVDRGSSLGADVVQFRLERIDHGAVSCKDAELEGHSDSQDLGLSVRVVHDGTFGFAATVELSPEAAARTAEQAIEVARVSAALNTERVELAPEPVHADVTWVSEYDVDPFQVPLHDRVAVLNELSARLLAADPVHHADATLRQAKDCTYYADSAGTTATQQRVRMEVEFTAVHIGDSGFETLRTLAPPAGRGWEWLTGGTGCWDWATELAMMPEQLGEKAKSPSVEPGTYDLVIDPTNLWLTIHESIGHATELDRVLGYEANYAGTSFAVLDGLGSLQYGSPVMQVMGDRTTPHGLATIGIDGEGVAAQEWELVRNGILVGYQLDRRIAARAGVQRSNGCAFADAPWHVPIQRMANVSLQPAPDGPSTEELIGRVDRGIYVAGDGSWSIDQQRYNFQFTGQRFHRIENGRLTGQLRDVAYQATTTDFWRSMAAVGGPQTWFLGGSFNCGKGQPAQSAPVSHGCPSALFRGIRILNARSEAGR